MTPEQLRKDGERTYVGYLKKRFPSELMADGVDAARLREWYEANEEYLGPGADRYAIAVDADLAALKLSNRTPAFLDWLLATLAKSPRDERALRLARRYLGPEHGKDAATATAWIRSNRPVLFFTDTGGYRWRVDVNARRTTK